MIDIHTHILFGVDDGCKTIEQSIQTIKSAIEHGVTGVFLTPHCSRKRKYMASQDVINQHVSLLREELERQKITMDLYIGSEIDEDDHLLDLLQSSSCNTMNETKYILIDFQGRKVEIDEVVHELKIRGYIPIIAHPERYKYLNDIKDIINWKSTGALVQVNASSLNGDKKVKKMFKQIIKYQLADFISSDTHGKADSYINYEKSIKYVTSKISQEYADKVFTSNAKDLLIHKSE